MKRFFSARLGRYFLVLSVMGLLTLVNAQYQLAMVIGNSMRPAYQTGDILLVSKQAYAKSDPERGDIVVARHGSDLIVKRVVGLPGEEVALQRGHLYIDGYAFPEHHAIEPGSLEITPGILFNGKFALVGDNRAISIYQCVHAVVSKDQIVGRVIGSIRLGRSTKMDSE